MLQTGHPDDLVLESYSMNTLEGDRLDAFEDHLLVCADCQNRVSEIDSFVRGMRSALAHPLPQPSQSPWSFLEYFRMPTPVWAAAATAAVGIAGIFVLQHVTPNSAPLAIALSATRGGFTPSVQAGVPLDLDLDVRDLASKLGSHIQIVNGEGTEVWSGESSPASNGHIHVLVKSRLGAGQYFVRIADPVGTHREYALRLGN